MHITVGETTIVFSVVCPSNQRLMTRIQGTWGAPTCQRARACSHQWWYQWRKKELISQGVDEANIYLKEVPGAFELPLATQFMAEKDGILSVISLGAIIRGDTPHFDFISSSCLEGLQEVSLKTRIPVICGVLTTNTIEQAEERSNPNKMNKGKEFALTALNMVDSLS